MDDTYDDLLTDETEVEAPAADVVGDHPDPIVLCEPGFDDSGRLVWGSLPLPR